MHQVTNGNLVSSQSQIAGNAGIGVGDDGKASARGRGLVMICVVRSNPLQ
jgi:hypothetical protein